MRTETDIAVSSELGRLFGGPSYRIWKISAIPDGNSCPERDGHERWQNFSMLPVDFSYAGPGGIITKYFQLDCSI